MKTAVFPISVDNSRFTTTLFSKLLRPVAAEYDKVVFLVADQLQLYNKATEVNSHKSLKVVLAEFAERNFYFEERKKWLEKIIHESVSDTAEPEWLFWKLADITDHKFSDVFRNVLLAYQTVPEFREDVEKAAEDYCSRKSTRISTNVERRLSESYILEEIAVNVRLRIMGNIQDEYYPFGYPKPMLRIYTDDYDFNAFDLAGLKSKKSEFRFHQWNESKETWELVNSAVTLAYDFA